MLGQLPKDFQNNIPSYECSFIKGIKWVKFSVDTDIHTIAIYPDMFFLFLYPKLFTKLTHNANTINLSYSKSKLFDNGNT